MEIDVGTMEQELAFKVKMHAYLYLDALIILKRGKGERGRLEDYMEKRIKAIEGLLNVRRPFVIKERDDIILEVK
ncbi:MAG: hypothetical protein QXO03_03320 [Thermoplasmatales archaeon]